MGETTIKRKRRWGLRLVAIGAVLAVLVGGGIAVAAAPQLEAEFRTRTVCADFTDAVGVYEGNAVAMMGLKVGKIERIEPNGNGVRMTLAVQHDLDLAADVGAVVIDSSIVADRRVEFSGPYRGGPKLADGACVSKERTKTPRGVSQAYQALDDFLKDALGPDGELGADTDEATMRKLLEFADENFAGRGPQLVQLLRNFVKLAGNPAETDEMLRSLLDNSDVLATESLGHWPEIEDVVKTVNQAGLAFVGFSEEFASGLKSAVNFVPVLGRAVGRFGDRLLSMVELITPWVQLLAPFATRIAQVVAQLPGLATITDQIFDTRTGALRAVWTPPTVSLRQSDLAGLCAILRKPAGCAKQDAAHSGVVQMILGGSA